MREERRIIIAALEVIYNCIRNECICKADRNKQLLDRLDDLIAELRGIDETGSDQG